MVDEKEILEKMLVDEGDVIKQLASSVEMAKDFFVIEKQTGRIIFKNFGELKDQQRICALLIGKYFASRLGIITENSMGVSEIAKELGRPMTALSGPLKELIKKGYVEKLANRKNIVAYHRITDIIKEYFGVKKHG